MAPRPVPYLSTWFNYCVTGIIDHSIIRDNVDKAQFVVRWDTHIHACMASLYVTATPQQTLMSGAPADCRVVLAHSSLS